MKNIKNLHISLTYISLILAMSVFSCTKDDPAPNPELVVSTESLSFSKAAETKSINIKTNVKWTITSSESWCTVSPASGEGTGTQKIDISVTENTTIAVRNATLTINAGGLSKQIAVTQAQNVTLTVNPATFNVLAVGEEIDITVLASAEYTVAIQGSWIKPSGSTASHRSFIVSANTATTVRQGTITFSIGNLSQTVTINQEGVALNIPSDKTGMDSDAPALAAKMNVGWNIGNSLEACSATSAGETTWGNPLVSKQLIDAVKNAGFNAVRIPCAWNGYIENQTTYKIQDVWLARVKEVVDYCVDNNMYAILNIHWDGGWLENNPTYAKQAEVNKKQKALWEQIAVYFRNYDEHLLFAGTNEVHADYGTPSAENLTVQMSFNQTFVDAVRTTGGRNAWRNLVVQAYNTNIDLAVNHLKMPTDYVDTRMMAEVHFYDPYDFCLDATSDKYLWGKDFVGSPNVSSWGQEAWADEAFGKMKTNFVDKGIPVILGEYCATLRSTLTGAALANHLKARNYFLQYVTQSAKNKGLIPFYWDNGNTGNDGSGLFNRSSGQQIHPDAIQAIVNAK